MLSPSKRESGFMNLDFSEEQKMLQNAARDFLAEQAPLERVREIFEGDEPMDRDLWKAAAEMGWLGTAVPEKFGGAGFGHLELAMIAEELGRALAPIPVSSSVYLASEAILRAGKPEQQSEHLPGLVSGERIGTFALAEQPGMPGLASLQTSFRDGRLTGTKLPVPDGDVADLCVVVARSDCGAPCLTERQRRSLEGRARAKH
jgi:alkylation response protein AidB-like acyl-CoA dehydrogenase